MPQALFIIQIIVFIFVCLSCFTIPGTALLKKSPFKFSLWTKIILSTVLGWIIFTLLGYILLILNLKIFILLVYAIIIFVSLKALRPSKLTIKRPNKLTLFLIPVFVTGVIMQLLIISPSGLEVNGDLLFWSSHAHDGSWHIALMNQMEKGWPIQNPAFAGERLVNYHFFSDIAPMYFNYLLKLPSLDLYFRFFPLFYSVIFGSLAFLFGRKLTGSFWGGFWSFIFADFAGSFGYILTFLKDRTIGGESIFWSSQPQSTIGNPPQISALILLLAFFYFFSIYLEKRSKVIFLSLLLIGGTLITFKVYAGIALLGGLGVCGLWQTIRERKFGLLFLFTGSAALSAILFFPNTAKSTSLLVFEPWWYIRTLVVAPDRLDKIEWELRRQTYIAENNLKRVIQLELQAFLIFFFGNLGMRFLGLTLLPKYLKSFFSNYLNQLLLSIILISFLFPMLFIQKGDTAGTSQFFQYYLLVFGLLGTQAILLLGAKIKPQLPKIIFGFLIILIAVPTQIGLLANFYQRGRPLATVYSHEREALLFLKNNTPENSIILTPLFNRYLKSDSPTPPIYGWSDSVYVAAFSERSVYLADEEQVANLGYRYQDRKNLEEQIFATKDPIVFDTLIKKSGANYLYFPTVQKPEIDLKDTNLKLIFSNNTAQIWKI